MSTPALRLATRVVAVAVLALPIAPRVAAQEGEPEPLRLPFAEEETVALTVVDVDLYDRKGRPRPGLSADEFEVFLNGNPWPVYSVDDFCPCSGPDTPPAVALATAAPPEPTRYVLYFDLPQLRASGRIRAVEAAQRWLSESAEAGDEVMVVAYGLASGLDELTEFTADHGAVARALGEVRHGRTQAELPQQIRSRVDYCADNPAACAADGSTDFFYTDAALERLRWFVATLDAYPGRKLVYYFYQGTPPTAPGNNSAEGTTSVGSAVLSLLQQVEFANPNEDFIEGQQQRAVIQAGIRNPLYSPATETLEDLLAAEATSARTTLFMAYTGDALGRLGGRTDAALGFGSRLADATGGEYNRSLSDLPTLLSDSSDRCECYYRISVEPPDKRRDRIFKMRVRAGGRDVPYRYRVQFMSEGDRWLRRVVGVLSRPETAADLEVEASIVPLRPEAGRWDATVRVSVPPSSLTLLPHGDRLRGGWEVGAVLVRNENQAFEMLGVSQVTHGSADAPYEAIVHERTFEGLRPGQYRLVAFVRDQSRDLFGGAEDWLLLPDPRKSGTIGPVLQRVDVRQLQAPLPLSRKDRETERGSEIVVGSTPTAADDLPRGSLVEMESWLCGRDRPDDPAALVTYVSRDGRPLFRPESAVEPIASCLRIADAAAFGNLPAGRYSYHVRNTTAGDAGELLRLDLDLAEPTP